MAEEGFKVASGYVSVLPDDEGFPAAVAAMVDAAFAEAGASGGLELMRALNATIGGIGDDAHSAILEALASAGASGGQDIAESLGRAGAEGAQEIAAAVGDAGGDGARLFGESLVDGIQGTGQDAARTVGDSLQAGMGVVGAAAGAELATAMAATGSSTGLLAAASVGRGLSAALQDVVGEVAVAAGDELAGAMGGSLAKSAADIAGAVEGPLTAAMSDVASQAGTVAGDQFAATFAGSVEESVAEIAAVLSDGLEVQTQGVAAAQGTRLGESVVQAIEEAEPEAVAASGAMGAAAGEEYSVEFAGRLREMMLNVDFSTVSDEMVAQIDQELRASVAQAAQIAYVDLPHGGLGAGGLQAAQESDQVAESVTKAGGAAEKATGEMGGMAAMMSGPLAMGLFGVMSAAPIVVDLFKDMDSSSRAVTLSQADLASAISTSGGTAGASVANYVASQTQINGLAASAAAAGVGLGTYTEAVLGNGTAQADVTAAVDRLNTSQHSQVVAMDEATSSTGKFSDETKAQTIAIDQRAQSDTKLSASNQQLLASMAAQAEQITTNITQQQQLAQATLALDQNSTIFSATLSGLRSQMQLTAYTTAESSVAALGLGNNEVALNQSLTASEAAYSLAQSGASAYSGALAAANGTAAGLIGAQVGVTTAMAGFTTSVKENGKSLDEDTVKGAANVTAALGVASAADKSATALYQSDLATKGASGAYQAANGYLQQQAQDFITAADKAGLNKTAVQQLANQLFQMPSSITTTVNIDDAAAKNALTELQTQMYQLEGVISSNPTNQGGLKGISHNADGGPVQAGEWSWVGERGPEIVRFPQDGQVIPNHQIPSSIGGSGPDPARGGGVTNINFYGPQLPNGEQTAQMRREFATVGTF